MTYLEDLVLVIHVLAALAIIGMVMLQRGKGAEMGAGFGSGASSTVFGSTGSGNFLTKMTSVAAVLFFLTSFSLAYFARERSNSSRDLGIPMVEQIEQFDEMSLPGLNLDADSSPEKAVETQQPDRSDEGDPDVPTVD